jgi:hypothetical protein
MSMCRRRSGRGVVRRHLVNKMASVLSTLTWSFHFEKYRSRADVAWVNLLTMVSVRQDRARMAVSSAYKTS